MPKETTSIEESFQTNKKHGLRRENIFLFSHGKSIRAEDHWVLANVDPMGMVGWIYVGDHYQLLHTQYISCKTRRIFLNPILYIYIYIYM